MRWLFASSMSHVDNSLSRCRQHPALKSMESFSIVSACRSDGDKTEPAAWRPPMIEVEWLTCTSPTDMPFFLRSKITDRKLRLIAAACCRRIWHLISDCRSREAVEWAERDAYELLSEERIAPARAAADALAHAYSILDLRQGNGHMYHAAWAAALSVYTPEVPLQTPVNQFQFHERIDCARDVLIHPADAYGISIHNDAVLRKS